MVSQTHDAQLVPIASLKPFKGNPRRGDVEAIRESLRVNGQYRPVVVRSKTREVLAGNHTLQAAQAEGWEQIWATFIDCDAKTAKRIVLVDNRSNDQASYDDDALLALLASLPELDGTGYASDDLEKLTKLVEFEAKIDRDSTPADIPETYDVLVTCASEADQVALLDRLTAEGLECRALLS